MRRSSSSSISASSSSIMSISDAGEAADWLDTLPGSVGYFGVPVPLPSINFLFPFLPLLKPPLSPKLPNLHLIDWLRRRNSDPLECNRNEAPGGDNCRQWLLPRKKVCSGISLYGPPFTIGLGFSSVTASSFFTISVVGLLSSDLSNRTPPPRQISSVYSSTVTEPGLPVTAKRSNNEALRTLRPEGQQSK